MTGVEVNSARSYACKNTNHVCREAKKETPLKREQLDECYIQPADTQGAMAGMVSYVPIARRAVSTVADRMIGKQPEAQQKQMKKLTSYFPGGKDREEFVKDVAKGLKESEAAEILLDDSCRELMKSLGVTQEDLEKLKSDDGYSFKKLTSESFSQEARDRVVSAALVLVLDLGIGAERGEEGEDKGKLVQELVDQIREILPEKVEKFLVGPDQIHDFLAVFVNDEGYQEKVATRLRQLVSTGFGNMLKDNDDITVKTDDGDETLTACMLEGLINKLVYWAKSLLNLDAAGQKKVDEYEDGRKYSRALTRQGFSASSQAVVFRTAAHMSESVAKKGEWSRYAAKESRRYNPLLEQMTAVPKKIEGERTDLAPGRNRYIAYLHHPGKDGKLDVARVRHILIQTYTSGYNRCLNVPLVVQGLIDTSGKNPGKSRKTLMQALAKAGLVTTDKHGSYVPGEELKPFGDKGENKANLCKFVGCITTPDQIHVIGRAILNATLTLQDKLNRKGLSQAKKDKYEERIANLEVAFQALFRSVSIDVLKELEAVENQHAANAAMLEKSSKKHSSREEHDSGSESDSEEDEDPKTSDSRKRKRKHQAKHSTKRRRQEETDEETPAKKKRVDTKKAKKKVVESSSSEGSSSEVEESESEQETSSKKAKQVSSKKSKKTSGKKPTEKSAKQPAKKKVVESSSSEGSSSEVEESESEQETSSKKAKQASSKKSKKTPTSEKTPGKKPAKKKVVESSSAEGSSSEVEESESEQDTSNKKTKKVSNKKSRQTPEKKQKAESSGSEVEESESDQDTSSEKTKKVSGKKSTGTKMRQSTKKQKAESSGSEGSSSEESGFE